MWPFKRKNKTPVPPPIPQGFKVTGEEESHLGYLQAQHDLGYIKEMVNKLDVPGTLFSATDLAIILAAGIRKRGRIC